ncbi:hypothetical protein HBA55_34380 [Pseudomaricurvus alkylphenolicus]|uniref:hypothetical protein n=1 Tax=Pseudomaricurvus alkylphenolicus TaxID=1306991 RepID=UPI0014207F3B|nr:hypothetical protein [Pseudomaricurvus alkylphenolicus]NIB44718.1 hypothetical protein [Pseudomaricurvus alkylphenolicus]
MTYSHRKLKIAAARRLIKSPAAMILPRAARDVLIDLLDVVDSVVEELNNASR